MKNVTLITEEEVRFLFREFFNQVFVLNGFCDPYDLSVLHDDIESMSNWVCDFLKAKFEDTDWDRDIEFYFAMYQDMSNLFLGFIEESELVEPNFWDQKIQLDHAYWEQRRLFLSGLSQCHLERTTVRSDT
nr:hypothetical protein [Armatimonas sp.]